MSRTFINRVLTSVALCSMLAGLAQGADIRYKASGDWFDVLAAGNVGPNGWQNVDGVPGLPGTNDYARINWANNTVTLANVAPEIKSLQTGVDEQGTLQIDAGGVLTSLDWSAIGNNGAIGSLVVNSNGVADFKSHLWVGFQSGATGEVDINNGGLVKVGGMLGAGWSGGVGHIRINKGGTLDLHQLHGNGTNSFQNGSYMDIISTGQVILPGDYSAVVSNYFLIGAIKGNGVVGNIDINVDTTTSPGVTNTILSALTAVPNVVGNPYDTAEQTLTDLDYGVGTVTTSYVYGVKSLSVLSQNPLPGAALPPGSLIDVEIQEANGPSFTAVWNPAANPFGSPVWEVSTNWTSFGTYASNAVPVKETQDFKVVFNVEGSADCTLSSFAAVAALVLGDNGDNTNNTLIVTDGGHLVAGKDGDWNTTWTGIGYNREATLIIETNGLVEAQSNVLVGHGAGGEAHTGTLMIDGGTFKSVNNWMRVGSPDTELAHGEVIVKNGGTLDLQRTIWGLGTNNVIYMEEGTMTQKKGEDGKIALEIGEGKIVIAPGYTYSLDSDITTPDRTTLRVFEPGYANWAKGFLPTVIGAEGDNYDSDVDDNFTEYVLNGDPTNALVTGVQPTFTDVGGSFEYTHLIRNDDPTLVYAVETKTDLLASWADTGYIILGTNVTGTAYDEVVNEIPTTADETFVHLKVSNP